MTGFDSASWKAQYNKFQINNPRAFMVTGLMKSILKKGMPKEEVRELLGIPEDMEEFRDIYYLGAAQYGIDFEYLEIEYTAHDTIDTFRIIRS